MTLLNRILILGAILAICYLAASVIQVLCVSILLAILLDPGVELLRRLRVPRPLGSGIMILVLLGLVYLSFLLLYSRVQNFEEQVPRYGQVIRDTVLNVQRRVQRLQRRTEEIIPPSPQPATPVSVVQHTDFLSLLFPGFEVVSKVAVLTAFIPVLVFFMLSWKEHSRKNFLLLFNDSERHRVTDSLAAIGALLRRYLWGNFLLGLLLSFLTFVLLITLKLPSAHVLALMSGFLNLVPYLGVVLALIPPLLVAFGQFQTLTPYLILIGCVIGLHLIGQNLLLPKLVGSMMDVNPLSLSVGMLIWGWLWGPLGLVLAIPIVAAAKAICDHTPSLRNYGRLLGAS